MCPSRPVSPLNVKCKKCETISLLERDTQQMHIGLICYRQVRSFHCSAGNRFFAMEPSLNQIWWLCVTTRRLWWREEGIQVWMPLIGCIESCINHAPSAVRAIIPYSWNENWIVPWVPCIMLINLKDYLSGQESRSFCQMCQILKHNTKHKGIAISLALARKAMM